MKKLKRLLKQQIYFGNNYKCNICGKKTGKMIKTGIDYQIFNEKDIIGGGVRSNGKCPRCFSIDRYRFLYYYLVNETNIFNEKCKVLHFSPENVLKEKIQKNKKCSYYPCNIIENAEKNTVDIMDIPFENNFFDYVICNHILEHVSDDNKALKELSRVIRNNGKVLITVPISISDKFTLEKKEINTEEDRIKFYGQKDHVRLYGKDFVDKLEKYFKVDEYICENNISLDLIKKYCLIEKDRIYVCTVKK